MMEHTITENKFPAHHAMQFFPAPAGINAINAFGHKHVEAFAIMQYAPTDASLPSIYVWNCRDGVTPYCLGINGIEYTHVNWSRDKYAPNYVPSVDDYIFRDATDEEARSIAEDSLERWKGSEYYPATEEEKAKLLDGMTQDNIGQVVLAKVTAQSFTSQLASRS